MSMYCSWDMNMDWLRETALISVLYFMKFTTRCCYYYSIWPSIVWFLSIQWIHTTHEMWIWHWVCHCIPNWFSSICLLSPCYGHRYSIAPPIPCETQDRHRDVVIRIMTDLVLQYIVVTRGEWPIKVHSLTMDHLCWQKDVAILQVLCLVDRREPCTGTVHFAWQTYLTIC